MFTDDLLARLAVIVSMVYLENKLELTDFANLVLLSGIVGGDSPTPEAAGLEGLVEETYPKSSKGSARGFNAKNFEVSKIWSRGCHCITGRLHLAEQRSERPMGHHP